MKNDIVERLRQGWLAHQDKDVRFVLVNAGEWMRCTDLTREAAVEIERLRVQRDEARREVCRDEASRHSPSPPCTATQAAARRGWDCFKDEP